MNFEDLGISEEIIEILKGLGFAHPTEVQQKSIPVILSGNEIICRSQTGSGKTFAFGVPVVQMIDKGNSSVQALVVCPTRELSVQVCDEIKKIATPLSIRTCAVFGGSNIDRQIKSLKKQPQIVVGTTGRIMDLIKRGSLKIETANYVVLDEADQMLDMGFKPDIEKILAHTKKEKNVLMFSATMPDGVKDIAKKFQNQPTIIEIGTENKALETIEQTYMFVQRKLKKQALTELFFSDVFGKTIVFVNTKTFADDVAHHLNKATIKCRSIHSDIRQNERKRVLENFKKGKFDVLVATDVASRGLDIDNVEWVINFDLPHETEQYVHRIGRTARAGKSGKVINLITSLEMLSQMKDIEKLTNANIQKFETASENLSQYFVDTKKIARERTQKKRENAEKKSKRFGTFEFLEYEIDDGFDSRKAPKSRGTYSKSQKKFKGARKNLKSDEKSFENSRRNFNDIAKAQKTSAKTNKNSAKTNKNSAKTNKNSEKIIKKGTKLTKGLKKDFKHKNNAGFHKNTKK